MRIALLLLCYFITFTFLGQDYNKSFGSIQKAEAKKALSKMAFKVNINTGNYDIKYHRLAFNLDPAIAFISGISLYPLVLDSR